MKHTYTVTPGYSAFCQFFRLGRTMQVPAQKNNALFEQKHVYSALKQHMVSFFDLPIVGLPLYTQENSFIIFLPS